MAQTATRTGISHIGFISINTRDLDRAIAFYRDDLGFEVTTDAPMGPDARWVELTPPGAQTRISLISKGNPAYDEALIGKGFAATFEVAGDFKAVVEDLRKRGVKIDVEPRQEPWGFWAEILDPDGNSLGLHGEVAH